MAAVAEIDRSAIHNQYSLVDCKSPYRGSMLNQSQRKSLDKIVKQSFEWAISRAVYFAADNPCTATGAFLPSCNDMVKIGNAASSGLAIGAVIGGCADRILKISAIAIAPEVSIVCGAIGIVGWYGKVTAAKIQKIKESDLYKTWIKTRNVIFEQQEINTFIFSDADIPHLACCLSGKLPLIPVKFDAYDEVYDYEEIEKWIKEHPGQDFQRTGTPINMSHLSLDFAHMQSMMNRLQHLMKEAVFTGDKDAYARNKAVDDFFDQGKAHVPGIRKLVLEYIDLSDVCEVQKDGSYKTTSIRKSNQLLKTLSRQIEKYATFIKTQEVALKTEYRALAAQNRDLPTKKMVKIIKAIDNLNHRKVLTRTQVDGCTDGIKWEGYFFGFANVTMISIKTIDITDSNRLLGRASYPPKFIEDNVWSD